MDKAYLSVFVLIQVLLHTSGHEFTDEYIDKYLAAEPNRVFEQLKARGFSKENHQGANMADRSPNEAKERTKRDDDYGYGGYSATPDIIEAVCNATIEYLDDSSIQNCSAPFFMDSIENADYLLLAEIMVHLVEKAVNESNAQEFTECVKSLVTIGSMYYIVTEKYPLGIHLSFYSALGRTLMTNPIPVSMMNGTDKAVGHMSYIFWWQPLKQLMDSMTVELKINESDWGHQISNNKLHHWDPAFPEWHMSVRKFLVRQVLFTLDVLDKYNNTFLAPGEVVNCTAVGNAVLQNIANMDNVLTNIIYTVFYDPDLLQSILKDAFGDAPFLQNNTVFENDRGFGFNTRATFVTKLQNAISTDMPVLWRAANAFNNLANANSVDEMLETALIIFIENAVQSARQYDDLSNTMRNLHLTIGSDIMNTNFYEATSTDLAIVTSAVLNELSKRMDVSVGQKMAEFVTGLLELKRLDYSIMNPPMWPITMKLVNKLTDPNLVAIGRTLVDKVLAKVFIKNLNMVKAGTSVEYVSTFVYLPYTLLHTFDFIPVYDMNHLAAMMLIVATPTVDAATSNGYVPRVTSEDMARLLNNFTAVFENVIPNTTLFNNTAAKLGGTWEVEWYELVDLVKMAAPAVMNDVTMTTVMLESFDSRDDVAVVAGSLLSSKLHNQLWFQAMNSA